MFLPFQSETKYQVVDVLGSDQCQYGVHDGPDDRQHEELDHRQQYDCLQLALLDQGLVREVDGDHAESYPQHYLDAHKAIPSLSSS